MFLVSCLFLGQNPTLVYHTDIQKESDFSAECTEVSQHVVLCDKDQTSINILGTNYDITNSVEGTEYDAINLMNESDVSLWEFDTSALTRLAINSSLAQGQANILTHYTNIIVSEGDKHLNESSRTLPDGCEEWSQILVNHDVVTIGYDFVERLWLICFSGIDRGVAIYQQQQNETSWALVYEDLAIGDTVTRNTQQTNYFKTGNYSFRSDTTAEGMIDFAEAINDNLYIKWTTYYHGVGYYDGTVGQFTDYTLERDFEVDTVLFITINSSTYNVYALDDLWVGRTLSILKTGATSHLNCDPTTLPEFSYFINVYSCSVDSTTYNDHYFGLCTSFEDIKGIFTGFTYNSFSVGSGYDILCQVSLRRATTAFLVLFDSEIDLELQLKFTTGQQPLQEQQVLRYSDWTVGKIPVDFVGFYSGPILHGFGMPSERKAVYFSGLCTKKEIQEFHSGISSTVFKPSCFVKQFNFVFGESINSTFVEPYFETSRVIDTDSTVINDPLFQTKQWATYPSWCENIIRIHTIGGPSDNLVGAFYIGFWKAFRYSEDLILHGSRCVEPEFAFFKKSNSEPIHTVSITAPSDSDFYGNFITSSKQMPNGLIDIEVRNSLFIITFSDTYLQGNVATVDGYTNDMRLFAQKNLLKSCGRIKGIGSTELLPEYNYYVLTSCNGVEKKILLQNDSKISISTDSNYPNRAEITQKIYRNQFKESVDSSLPIEEVPNYIRRLQIQKAFYSTDIETIQYDHLLERGEASELQVALVDLVRVEKLEWFPFNGNPILATLEVYEDRFRFRIGDTLDTIYEKTTTTWNPHAVVLIDTQEGITVISIQHDGSSFYYTKILYDRGSFTTTELTLSDTVTLFQDDSTFSFATLVSFMSSDPQYSLQCSTKRPALEFRNGEQTCIIILHGSENDFIDMIPTLGSYFTEEEFPDNEVENARFTSFIFPEAVNIFSAKNMQKFSSGTDFRRALNQDSFFRFVDFDATANTQSAVCYMTPFEPEFSSSPCLLLFYITVSVDTDLEDGTVAPAGSKIFYFYGHNNTGKLLLEQELGVFEECSGLSMDNTYYENQIGAFTVFSCRDNTNTWHSFGSNAREMALAHSLNSIVSNASIVSAWRNHILLLSDSDNKIVSIGTSVSSVTVTFDSSADYIFVHPFGVSTQIEISDKGVSLPCLFLPGNHTIFAKLNNFASRVPVHHQALPQLILYSSSKNESTVSKFVHSALDRHDTYLFFFDDVGDFTALIVDEENKPLETSFKSFYSHSNIEWYRFSWNNSFCPGDEEYEYPTTLDSLEIAVPFYTNESLSATCDLTNKPITLPGTFLQRLSHFRLDVSVQYSSDTLCVGGSSVDVLGSCNHVDLPIDATTPCSTSSDQYTCIVDSEIFFFGDKKETVATQCISLGGYCLQGELYASNTSAQNHQECEDECFSNPDCFFFEHSPGNCTTYEHRPDGQFFEKKCVGNTLGFQCRTVSDELIRTNVIFDPGEDYPFKTIIFHDNAEVVSLFHGKSGASNSRMMHTGNGNAAEFTLTFFETDNNVTGGTIVFGCG